MDPEGMLDRDQRTAKISLHRHRCISDNVVPNRTNSIINSFKASSSSFNSIITHYISRRKASRCSYFMWKKGYLIPKFQRLKNVLLVIVYLMITVLPTTHSAPSTMNPPRIVCPTKLLNNCLIEINVAKVSADSLKDHFKEYSNWVHDSSPIPSWLPDIGKTIDEDIRESLKTLEAKDTIPLIYINLQKLSRVLENALRELNGKPFSQDLEILRENNNPIFEALKQVMGSMGIHTSYDATDASTDVLPPEIARAFRDGDVTTTTAFVTIIFRECLNNYQYAQQALSQLLDGCP